MHSVIKTFLLLQTYNYYYSEQNRRFKVLVNESKVKNDTLPHTEDSAYMFDAIWTAALALNRTKSKLAKRNLSFRNFSYDTEIGHEIANCIYEEALKVKFFGLTVSNHSYTIQIQIYM